MTYFSANFVAAAEGKSAMETSGFTKVAFSTFIIRRLNKRIDFRATHKVPNLKFGNPDATWRFISRKTT